MKRPQQNKVQAEIMQAYRDVFLHTPQGNIIFKDMLKVSGLYQITGHRDANEIIHMEGARDMIRRVITILALDEEQITQLAVGETIDAE